MHAAPLDDEIHVRQGGHAAEVLGQTMDTQDFAVAGNVGADLRALQLISHLGRRHAPGRHTPLGPAEVVGPHVPAQVPDRPFGGGRHGDQAQGAVEQALVVAEGVLHPGDGEAEAEAEGAEDRPGNRAHAADDHHDHVAEGLVGRGHL